MSTGTRRRRVVVCGGGVAGVAAAVEASGLGAEVTLVERRPFLGGKAYSFTDSSGHEIDNGQHVFLGCCPAYIGLLNALGTLGHTTLQSRLHAPVRDRAGRRGALSGGRGPAPLHLASSFARYPFLSTREKAAAARALAELAVLSPGARRRLDEATFADWLQRRGQSGNAVRSFWDLIVLPTCNDRSDRVSATLAAFVFQEGFLRRAKASAIGYSRVGLTHLLDPAARELLSRRGGRVVTGRAVTEAGPGGVRLDEDEHMEADAVVLALPARRAAAVSPAAVPEPPDLGASPIVNVHVWYDRPVMDEPMTAVIDSPAQWVFNRTAMAGTGRPGQQLAVSISGAHDEIAVERHALGERMVAELEELFPRARGAVVENVAVVKEAEATFAAAPGQASRRPGPHTPFPEVALAGAWTATGWPATMEGAARSGMRAARLAMGRSVPAAVDRFG